MPKEKLPAADEQKIEEIKKAFAEPRRGSSLGELRRATRGGAEKPTEMTEAEKELANTGTIKTDKTVIKKQSPMEKLASRLMVEIRESQKQEELKRREKKEAKRKELEERYLAQFKREGKPTPTARATPTRSVEAPVVNAEEIQRRVEAAPMPKSERRQAEEARVRFEEREATMDTDIAERRAAKEPSAPLESLPILEDEEIPGIEMPRSGRQQAKKLMPASPKKPWWKKAIDWLLS